jgi:hypothetical protein
MRRTLWLALLGGVVVLTPAAQAAPSPQVIDPKGDWQVASQDILSGRLSSVIADGKPALRGELTLAAAPAAGVVTTYSLSFMVGSCDGYTWHYVWGGAAPATKVSLEQVDFCHQQPTQVAQADHTYAASATLSGSTIVWQAPYVGMIKRGAKAGSFAALACPVFGGVSGGDTITGSHEAWTGDIAYGANRSYVIGSDLPRR